MQKHWRTMQTARRPPPLHLQKKQDGAQWQPGGGSPPQQKWISVSKQKRVFCTCPVGCLNLPLLLTHTGESCNHQGPVYVQTPTSGFHLKWWKTFALWQQKEQRVSWAGVWLGHWQRVWREYWPVWQDRQTANIGHPAGSYKAHRFTYLFCVNEMYLSLGLVSSSFQGYVLQLCCGRSWLAKPNKRMVNMSRHVAACLCVTCKETFLDVFCLFIHALTGSKKQHY